ncbi:MAG TPA: protein kinase [Vicinamibacterales bacterium]|nr:protein kinase [Vicinamibacterales bacterium]
MIRIDRGLWRALSPLLDQGLDLDADARDAWLASLEGERPELARILARLLKQHDRLLRSEFLESPAVIEDTPVSLTGQTIGPYTLEALLGMGGTGTVWRAHRSDGRFEGSVAVKLLNLALIDHHGDERFKREGTLLARLAHPHIARLLDAGVTSTAQPYLVLEYVDGIPIDRFADEHRLDPVARLELFLQVADAVAYAHAALIVHRDLKPSNILVGADRHIKLVDFGIGKLLEENSNPQSTVTIATANALTPEYAAPEQVRGEHVTTATDIYALGVLLHTLLTGRHPTGDDCRSSADHLHAVLDRDPVRASAAVIGPTPSEADARAALRQSTPERLRRLYRGDIDNVLGKALEKTPGRRYASVTALTDDIRRFLNHEPISVHGQAWSYRTAKFARRHRWPVAAALVAVVMLTTGLVIAERQRMVAERRFGELRQLSQQVFDLDNKIQGLAGATEAREALVAASLTYLEGLARDAGSDLDLLQEVSDGYWRVARIQGVPMGLTLGNFAKAEDSLKTAEGLVTTILSVRPRDSRALERGAMIAHDRMIVADSERREADALAHARNAVERIEAMLAEEPSTESYRASAYFVFTNVALAHVNLRRYDQGVRYSRRALDLATEWRLTPQQFSGPLGVLSNALRSQGDLEGALKAIREARALIENVTYKDDTSRMIARYGVLLREAFILGEDRGVSLNRPEEAAAVLQDALAMCEAAARLDPNDYTSRTRIGTVGRELGDILRWRAPEEAIAVYDAALARLAEIRDNLKARRDRALILANSSYALRRVDRTAEAKTRVDEALAILKETKDHPSDRIPLDSELRSVLQAQADLSAHEGQVGEAIQNYEQLIGMVMQARPDLENDLREAYSFSLLQQDLTRLYRSAGAFDKADTADAKRLALWTGWNDKLPNNPFVLQQLAAVNLDVTTQAAPSLPDPLFARR